MGNTASKNENGKTQRKLATLHLSARAEVVEEEEVVGKQQQHQKRDLILKSLDENVTQTSTWSLGSLSGRFNWSSIGTTKSSFRNRNKSTRKSLTTVERCRRCKTIWHQPLTNSIFSAAFKQSSCYEQFFIEQLVAKGSFGVVFKVIDKKQPVLQQQSVHERVKPATPIFYALKELKKSKIIEENCVQQIKDEVNIQKLCGHHPFIVHQVDLWQNRRNLYILSEYMPNGELFSKIKKFSVDLTRFYLAEIAIGIDFLHNAGIIYRDAKPENILLTESFHIKLTDFGLSKWLKLGATTKTMCGTFQYMAPEILRGEAYGHAVDWWSLGIIGCQMLTQRSPDIKSFLDVALPSDKTAASTIDAVDQRIDSKANLNTSTVDLNSSNIQNNDFLPPEVAELPHAAKDVLQRLLQLKPQQRIRSVLALQKISLYKNFKLEAEHLQSICPLQMLAESGLEINTQSNYDGAASATSAEAFHGF